MSGIPRRALRAGGVVAATALVLTGCLQNPNAGGGGGGAGGGAAVVDGGTRRRRQEGDDPRRLRWRRGEELQRLARRVREEPAASTSQYTADQDFTTTIKQKVNSGDSPDIGLFPQPGGLLEFAAQNKVAADRHLPRLRQARRHPAPRLPRRRPLQGPGLRRADAARGQEHRLVPEGGLRRQGGYDTDADDHPGAADRRRRQDQGRPASPRGAWAGSPTRRPAGSAPTGSRSSCCACTAPTSTTTGPRTGSRSTTSASSRPSTSSPRSPRTRRWCSAAPRACSTPPSATR